MPLPPSTRQRQEIHLRSVEVHGYECTDGLFELDARIVDTKLEDTQLNSGRWLRPGDVMHDMSVRLVLDEDFTVVEVVATIDASPHDICQEATATLQSIKGLRIASGWSRAIRERLAGSKGCTHLTDLLSDTATVSLQTLRKVQLKTPDVDASGKPGVLDKCYGYAAERRLAKKLWPIYFERIAKQAKAFTARSMENQ